jgi:hypothetical protein
MAAALPFLAVALPVALSAVSAYGQYKAGRAEAKGLARQSAIVELQGRSEALRYREEAVATMDRILRTQATINARAGAGAIDPFSGSALAIQDYAMAEGATEIYVSRDNEIVAREGGLIQATELRKQAKSVHTQGLFKAGTTIGSSLMRAASIGGPSGSSGGSSTAAVWT